MTGGACVLGALRRALRARGGAAVIALCCAGLPVWALEPLTDAPGDPAAGRAIVTDATKGLCVLCHAGPWEDVPFMGDLAPDLTGVGARLDVAELRQRIVDSRVLMPQTIMPPYHSLDGLTRVGGPWQGETILSAAEVEDVVAYLATLTAPDAPEGAMQ